MSLRITEELLMVNSFQCKGLNRLKEEEDDMRLYCYKIVHLHERHMHLERSDRYCVQ